MDIGSLIRRWEDIRATTRKLAEAIPPGREGYRPVEGVMPLGEHFLHVVSSEKTAVDAFTDTPGQWEWKTGVDLEHYPTGADILRALDEQSEKTRAYFSGLKDADLVQKVKLPWGDEWTLDEMWYVWLFHEVHHRGSVITTMRVAGITPPRVY
jgi:uncharacterized damage-inducible protein DinB